MPHHHSISVAVPRNEFRVGSRIWSRYDCLAKLREHEYITYHHICAVFRAQGYLTSEKLRLLKEMATVLCIPDVRHRAEIKLAINNQELSAIAECVSGPDTEMEWAREARDLEPTIQGGPICASSLQMADAVAAAVRHIAQGVDFDKTPTVTRTIKLKAEWLGLKRFSSEQEEVPTLQPKKIKKEEDKEEEESSETSSSVSTTTECSCSTTDEDSQQTEEAQKVDEEEAKAKETAEMNLMPPPPTVITVPPPSPAAAPTPPLITVPPSSNITVLPISSPPVSAFPAPPPLISTSTTFTELNAIPISSTEISSLHEAPILSESDDVQFVSFSEPLDSLPPLVVVPPAEPVITVPHSSSFSPPPPASTLVLPSGMSIQVRDDSGDAKKRKRTISASQETQAGPSAPKTMAFNQISKMTPVMVSTATVSSAGQVRVTPIISRSRTVTTTSLPSSAQKVIIVSNTTAGNSPMIQHMPLIRANQPRFQTMPVMHSTSGLAKVRPKMMTVPAKGRGKASPLVIPMSGNTIQIKQDNVTVVDAGLKRVPGSPGPAKILPKPQGRGMYIVNPSTGTHKIATTIAGGHTRMVSPRLVSQGEAGTTATLKTVASKQNVVILQKGGTQRTLTLTNTSKDLVQKLMSKKCVVIQSSKMPNTVQKSLPPKPKPAPPPQPPIRTPTLPPVTTSASNVVVLDLSQEQYQQGLSNTTIAELLQASGIMTSPVAASVTQAQSQKKTIAQVSQQGSSWLPVEASRSLSQEEITLPLGQSESVVTLDEAVELLGEPGDSKQPVPEAEHMVITIPDTFDKQPLQPVDRPEEIFTITPEELAASEMSFMTDNPVNVTTEHLDRQIALEAVPSEVSSELDEQAFVAHKDRAVTIQHSNIDMPSNMGLEEYSSQQLENQGLN